MVQHRERKREIEKKKIRSHEWLIYSQACSSFLQSIFISHPTHFREKKNNTVWSKKTRSHLFQLKKKGRMLSFQIFLLPFESRSKTQNDWKTFSNKKKNTYDFLIKALMDFSITEYTRSFRIYMHLQFLCAWMVVFLHFDWKKCDLPSEPIIEW